MAKTRPRKPSTRPASPSAEGPPARSNPELAFARPLRTGGAWFPAVWPM